MSNLPDDVTDQMVEAQILKDSDLEAILIAAKMTYAEYDSLSLKDKEQLQDEYFSNGYQSEDDEGMGLSDYDAY